MEYKISQYARKNNVTIRTVWNWIKKEKVKTKRTKTGGWLIVEENDNKNDKLELKDREWKCPECGV
ncbi:MAG: hypothetical protein ACOC33_04135, partial [bacterium]